MTKKELITFDIDNEQDIEKLRKCAKEWKKEAKYIESILELINKYNDPEFKIELEELIIKITK